MATWRERLLAILDPARTAAPPASATPASPEAKATVTLTDARGADFFAPHGMVNRDIVWLSRGTDDPEELGLETAYGAAVLAYAAIRYRALKVAEPPLFVAGLDAEGNEEFLARHRMAGFLEFPSPDYDMGELITLTQTWLDMTGAALWVKDGDTAYPSRVVPFSGWEFKVRPGDGRIAGRFEVKTASGMQTIDPDQAVFFRNLNPTSRTLFLSPLETALSWLNLGNTAKRITRAILLNSLFPGGIYALPKDASLGDEERDRIETALFQKYLDPSQKGLPLVVEGGGTFTVTTFPLDKLIPSDILNRVEATVCLAFGVRPEVLGAMVGLENSPWSHMETARAITYDDTIIPLWRSHERVMTRQLLPEAERNAGRKIRFDISDVAALQEDDQERATVAQTNARIWTLNERRLYTGKDALPADDPRGDFIEGWMAGTEEAEEGTEEGTEEGGEGGAAKGAVIPFYRRPARGGK